MQFRIADTFSAGLARLTPQERKAVKTTVFDLQVDPSNPGMQMHRIDGAKDPNFWSVRVNRDIRIILHRTDGSILLAYVDHHDRAYAWAERRKLEVHPRTGAAQFVELRERVEEIVTRKVVQQAEPPVLAGIGEELLLACGVPEEWLSTVKTATEDGLLDIAEHLPAEAAEALLTLATGGRIEPQTASEAPATPIDPFEHPDAQRRFRILANRDELEQALDYPWEQWTVFLHPAQRDFVDRCFNGPARVSGSAGTGKTVVALHRAVALARRYPGERILLTTFTEALANALRLKLRRLVGGDRDVLGRIVVRHLQGIGKDLHEARLGPVEIASDAEVASALRAARDGEAPEAVSNAFLRDEWSSVVDAWGVMDWASYREVPRLGRKTRVGGRQRERLWGIFEEARRRLAERGLTTWSTLFLRLADTVTEDPPFRAAVVDEAQDVSVAELRFLAALAGDRPDAVFLAGDIGQRIFRQPFSWKAAGVDIRGRARVLKVNYRTSHQIRARSDLLLPDAVSDVDGNAERRDGVVSVFNGAEPDFFEAKDREEEIERVADWLRARRAEGVQAEEIGIFTRTIEELERAREAAEAAGLAHHVLTGTVDMRPDRVALSTMHVAKGLEFRAVAVMACDEDVLPLASRIEAVTDESDLEEVYNTERHLLYVACTRARDRLLVSGVSPVSEFVDDIQERSP